MSMVTEAPLKNAVPTDQELIDFVVREARLIDQQRFDEWLDMYADDAFYWMPLEWNQTDPRLTCSLMYEDKLLLSIRVERLKGARTFSQKPKSRCHHVLQTPQVDSRDAAANSYVTWTPIHYVETRLDEQALYAAWVTHHLSVENGKLQHQAQARRPDQLRCCLRQHPALYVTENERGPPHGDRERRQYRHWRGDRPRPPGRGL